MALAVNDEVSVSDEDVHMENMLSPTALKNINKPRWETMNSVSELLQIWVPASGCWSTNTVPWT